MSDHVVNRISGLFGKLPAHGDFVRRGLPGTVVAALDTWLQCELGRAEHPANVIAAMPPVRFTSTNLLDGCRAVGIMIASTDSIGRNFPLLALSSCTADAAGVTGCENWFAGAEALLISARDNGLSAEAALASLSGLPDVSNAGFGELPCGEEFDRLTGQPVVE